MIFLDERDPFFIKFVIGIMFFVVAVCLLYGWDKVYNYRLDMTEGEYISVDIETPTDINDQLFDHSVGRTFRNLGRVTSYLKNLFSDMIRVFGVWSGDYKENPSVTSRYEYVSAEAYFDNLAELQEYIYETGCEYIDTSWRYKVTVKSWHKDNLYKQVYGTSVDVSRMFQFEEIESTSDSLVFRDKLFFTVSGLETLKENTGIDEDDAHTLLCQYYVSHYYQNVFYDFQIVVPPLTYGPPAPEETTMN